MKDLADTDRYFRTFVNLLKIGKCEILSIDPDSYAVELAEESLPNVEAIVNKLGFRKTNKPYYQSPKHDFDIVVKRKLSNSEDMPRHIIYLFFSPEY